MAYDNMFTLVDEFHHGGLNLTTGVFRAPQTGIYLVNFDTQVDSGPGPRPTDEYYSAYIRLLHLRWHIYVLVRYILGKMENVFNLKVK